MRDIAQLLENATTVKINILVVKEELERDVSKLKREITELKKKREDLELDYEKKMRIVEHRLSEIKKAWSQMVQAAEAKGVVLPNIGF